MPVFIMGLLMLAAGVSGWALGIDMMQSKAAPVRPVRAVAFSACGDTAGILVIKSDGSSMWYRPPYQGLAEVLVHIPDTEQMGVAHCPEHRADVL